LKIEQLSTSLSGECIYFIFVEKFYVPKDEFNALIDLKCSLSHKAFTLGQHLAACALGLAFPDKKQVGSILTCLEQSG